MKRRSIYNFSNNMRQNIFLNPNILEENMSLNQFNNNLQNNFPLNLSLMNNSNISSNGYNWNWNSFLNLFNCNQFFFNFIKQDIDLNYKISNISIELINKKNGKKELKKYIISNHNQENKEKEYNHKKSKVKPENIINIEYILLGKEKRTFVRIHPIPKRFSVYDMIKLIDRVIKTKPGERIYNAVYLPSTKIIGKNMGYCFINLVSPQYVIYFYNIFNGFIFRFKKNKKSCSVIFADNQEVDLSNDEPSRRPIVFNDTIDKKIVK